MRISVTWHTPVPLQQPMSRLHECFDLEELPPEPAIYLFARQFGRSMKVLYVGQANSLRKSGLRDHDGA
jgi:hypothetical protein